MGGWFHESSSAVRWDIFTMGNCINRGIVRTPFDVHSYVNLSPRQLIRRHNGTWIYCPQFITMKREKLLGGNCAGVSVAEERDIGEFQWGRIPNSSVYVGNKRSLEHCQGSR